jgi:hypothetical protein
MISPLNRLGRCRTGGIPFAYVKQVMRVRTEYSSLGNRNGDGGDLLCTGLGPTGLERSLLMSKFDIVSYWVTLTELLEVVEWMESFLAEPIVYAGLSLSACGSICRRPKLRFLNQL